MKNADAMKTRIYFLDNLRTFLIFLVVVLHAGIVYEPILEYTWIVSDPVKSSSIGFIRMYIDLFVMFVMFFISGYFIPASLKNKTDWQFISSKFKRIMLPWIVAVFTLIPAYKFIFLYSRGLPQEEWFTYFHLFQRAGGHMGYFADNPAQSWLWFLPILFLFQIAYLLLSKTRVLSINITLKTAVLLTLLIGISYAMMISNLNLIGWFHSALLHFQRERLLIYFLVFLIGTLCYKLKVFESTDTNKKLYLWANVVVSLSITVFTIVALNLFFNMLDASRNYYFVSETIDRIAYHTSMQVSMFSIMYLLIHLFRFKFNKTNQLLNELNKNSYGVYINHMLVLGLVALLLINVSLPAMVKFLILTICTYVITNVLVYGYRVLLQEYLSIKLIPKIIVLAALLLSVTIYAKQMNTSANPIETLSTQSEPTQPTTSLHSAVIQGNLEIVQQHILSGSDLNIKEPSGGSSPLISAALFGKVDIALALIEAGADVNFKNNEGSTPLHTAAFFCQPELVEALLNNGADKNLRNNSGATAFDAVAGPYETVGGIYEYFAATLGPLGLELDYGHIKETRPLIANLLK